MRTVAQTLPYRTTVLHPGGGPRRRWRRAYDDDFRLWGDPKGYAVIVQGGVTRRARWQLYLRLPARGGMCVGLSARALWDAYPEPSGEGCGARTLRTDSLTRGLGMFQAARLGVFAYGRVADPIVSVRIRFDGEDWREIQTVPTPDPPGGRNRFWVAPARQDCPAFAVQGLDLQGQVVEEQRLDAIPGPPKGSPDPYAACRNG